MAVELETGRELGRWPFSANSGAKQGDDNAFFSPHLYHPGGLVVLSRGSPNPTHGDLWDLPRNKLICEFPVTNGPYPASADFPTDISGDAKMVAYVSFSVEEVVRVRDAKTGEVASRLRHDKCKSNLYGARSIRLATR